MIQCCIISAHCSANIQTVLFVFCSCALISQAIKATCKIHLLSNTQLEVSELPLNPLKRLSTYFSTITLNIWHKVIDRYVKRTCAKAARSKRTSRKRCSPVIISRLASSRWLEITSPMVDGTQKSLIDSTGLQLVNLDKVRKPVTPESPLSSSQNQPGLSKVWRKTSQKQEAGEKEAGCLTNWLLFLGETHPH